MRYCAYSYVLLVSIHAQWNDFMMYHDNFFGIKRQQARLASTACQRVDDNTSGHGLVASGARSAGPLPFESKQHFLKTSQVSCTRTCPRNRLGLRVLELDQVSDASPCRAGCERFTKSILELFLPYPVSEV